MKIELWLINEAKPGDAQRLDVDLPAIPREGEMIIAGATRNYKVRDVIYPFDDDMRFVGRIRVEAWSQWDCRAR